MRPQGEQVQVRVGVDELLGRPGAPDEPDPTRQPERQRDQDRDQRRRRARGRGPGGRPRSAGPRPAAVELAGRPSRGVEGCLQAVPDEGHARDLVRRAAQVGAQPRAGATRAAGPARPALSVASWTDLPAQTHSTTQASTSRSRTTWPVRRVGQVGVQLHVRSPSSGGASRGHAPVRGVMSSVLARTTRATGARPRGGSTETWPDPGSPRLAPAAAGGPDAATAPPPANSNGAQREGRHPPRGQEPRVPGGDHPVRRARAGRATATRSSSRRTPASARRSPTRTTSRPARRSWPPPTTSGAPAT